MSEFRVVRHYPHPVEVVWRALTDPDLVPRWTSTGRGGRPEGFAPVVGTRFRFVAKPANPGAMATFVTFIAGGPINRIVRASRRSAMQSAIARLGAGHERCRPETDTARKS